MRLFDMTVSSLERGLDFSATKNKVIQQNIANVDTPNYKAKAVDFQAIYNQEKEKQLDAYRTNERHVPFSKSPQHVGVHTYDHLKYRQNGNGVDMDYEQAKLAENQIYYHSLVDRLNGKFNTLQQVIRGGR